VKGVKKRSKRKSQPRPIGEPIPTVNSVGDQRLRNPVIRGHTVQSHMSPLRKRSEARKKVWVEGKSGVQDQRGGGLSLTPMGPDGSVNDDVGKPTPKFPFRRFDRETDSHSVSAMPPVSTVNSSTPKDAPQV